MKKSQIINFSIIALLAVFLSSCSMRYSDTGKPFDFLKAQNMSSSKKNVKADKYKSSQEDFAKQDLADTSEDSKKEAPSKKRGGDMTILLILLAILIPCLAVGIYEGITTRFWISLVLMLLFWIPGIVYAILVVTGTI